MPSTRMSLILKGSSAKADWARSAPTTPAKLAIMTEIRVRREGHVVAPASCLFVIVSAGDQTIKVIVKSEAHQQSKEYQAYLLPDFHYALGERSSLDEL